MKMKNHKTKNYNKNKVLRIINKNKNKNFIVHFQQNKKQIII